LKIYFLPIEETKKINESIFETTFPNRYLKYKKCINMDEKLRILGAGALLYGVLGVSESDISFGPNGKPYIPNSNKYFNLSHSGNYSVLAVSDKDVGVDIEKIDEKHLKVADKIFDKEEISWMNEDPLYRFHHLWTLKESYLKLIGKGLTVSPSSFSMIPIVKSGQGLIFDEICYAKTIHIDDNHVVSVCSNNKIPLLETVFCKADIIKES